MPEESSQSTTTPSSNAGESPSIGTAIESAGTTPSSNEPSQSAPKPDSGIQQQAPVQEVSKGSESIQTQKSDDSSKVVKFSDFKKQLTSKVPDNTVPEPVKDKQEPAQSKADDVSLQQQQTQQPTKPQLPSRASQLKELGIPESKYNTFEKMSNEAFAEVKGVLEQNKKFEKDLQTAQQQLQQLQTAKPEPGQLPSNYYEHPDAYLLHPEYAKAEQALINTEIQTNHWIQQMDAIDRGEKVRDLVQGADGKITLGQELEPTNEIRFKIQQRLAALSQQTVNANNKLQEIQTGFKQTWEADRKFVESIQQKFFPGYEKPDHPERKLMDDVKLLIPEGWRNHPLSDILAMTTANNKILANDAKQWKDKYTQVNAELTTLKKPQQQPTAPAFNGSSTTPQVVPASFTEFQKRLRSGM